MEQTNRLQMPYILPSQAQKHVTHNEALRSLDAIVHAAARTIGTASPPISPTEGDCHVIGATPGGDWTGHANEFTCRVDGAWQFHPPVTGMRVWDTDGLRLVVWTGTQWTQVVGADLQRFEKLGVHADADSTNRLAVSSPATLLTHSGSDHRLVINKNAPANTASVVFQDGFAGRAEFGLTGDDSISLKVSHDGSQWKTALSIDAATGEAALPATPSIAAPALFNLLNDGGRFAGSPEPQAITVGAFVAPSYLSLYNGGVFSAGPKFTHNNSTHGGTAAALSPEMSALIQKMRPGTNPSLWRYGPEFHCARLVAGGGTSVPLTVGATTFYVAVGSATYPIPRTLSLNFWIMVESGSACLNLSNINGLFIDGAKRIAPEVLTPSNGWLQATRRYEGSASSFISYDNNLLMLHATPGASILIAAPILFPGHFPIKPATPYGLINSLTVWR